MILKRWLQRDPVLKGSMIYDRKTKKAIQRMRPGQIVVLNHDDIDEVAARNLIRNKVRAVINLGETMTGRYPTPGPRLLIHKGVAVFDVVRTEKTMALQDGMDITIAGGDLFLKPRADAAFCLWARVEPVTRRTLIEKNREAQQNLDERLRDFVENTLDFAHKEKDDFLRPFPRLNVGTTMAGRHVLVVVRGSRYREDLAAVRPYIDDYRPVLIGVDGGADALAEFNLKPDLIVGDMDSVSDRTLRSCGDIVVHAYPSGDSPGIDRLDRLNVPFHSLPFPGTSEDVSMLLAYEKGAKLIVSVGAHTNMVDFLEKGRKGMASTLLARMKIGDRLVDAKGVSQLYAKNIRVKSFFYMGAAAAVPLLAMSGVSSNTRELWNILWLQLKFLL